MMKVTIWCTKCEKVYKWDHDDSNENYFHPWEVVCPECGEERIYFREIFDPDCDYTEELEMGKGGCGGYRRHQCK